MVIIHSDILDELRPAERNKSPALLVFVPVFGVAPNASIPIRFHLGRLEDQHTSGAILRYSPLSRQKTGFFKVDF